MNQKKETNALQLLNAYAASYSGSESDDNDKEDSSI